VNSATRPLSATAVLAALLAVAGVAAAESHPAATPGSGGAGLTSPAGTSALRALTKPANMTVTETSAGLTLATTQSALLNRPLSFRGTTARSRAGDTVVVERRRAGGSGPWATTATATVDSTGSFTTTWRVSQSGRLSIRALVLPPGATPPIGAPGAAATAAAAAPATAPSPAPSSVTVTVLRIQVASWYGPGFFGHRTACGQRLRATTLGVASPNVKCGRLVDLVYHGRSLTVPVVDRGPYASGVQWDLTEATAIALGMRKTDAVGALPIGPN